MTNRVTLEELLIGSINTGLDAIRRAPIVAHETEQRCLRIQDISNSKPFTEWGFTETKETDYEKYRLRTDDIIMARTCSTGICYLVKNDMSAVFNNGLARIRVDKSRTDPSFLYYIFKSKQFESYIDGISGGTSVQLNMKVGDLAKFEFSVPKLSTQKAIAHILGTLDGKIELNQKINQTLEDIAKSIFKSWFVDFDPVRAKAEGRPTGLPPEISDLFPDELVDSEIGEIPKGWEVTIVSDFGKVVCGKTPSTKDPDNFEGEFPFITIPDMRGNLINLSTERSVSEKGATVLKGKLLPAGSICISCIATPGLVSITSCDSFTNQQINSIVPGDDVDKEYLLFSMMTFGDLISSAGSGGSVFANLSTGRFKELPILRANEKLRSAFSRLIRPILQRIELSQKEIYTLSELRDALLPKLISGELRIPDAERFLAEAGI
jgi:type I restriction enzyme S subunit